MIDLFAKDPGLFEDYLYISPILGGSII